MARATIKAFPALALLASGWTSSAVAEVPEIPSVHYPALAPTAADPAGFVPSGWAIVASRSGDLNGDGAADIALLLQMRDPANVLAVRNGEKVERFDTNPHLLAIAFAEPGRGYRLAATSHRLFIRPSRPWSGDEPPGADSILLERGGLIVNFAHLRGWSRYRFRWRDGAFRLTGYDSSGASGNCVQTVSINYLTGKARLTNEPMSSDRERAVWRRLHGAIRPTLDRIDLGTFRPEAAIAGPALNCPSTADE